MEKEILIFLYAKYGWWYTKLINFKSCENSKHKPKQNAKYGHFRILPFKLIQLGQKLIFAGKKSRYSGMQYISGISQAYLRHISGICHAYLRHISGISQAHLRHIRHIGYLTSLAFGVMKTTSKYHPSR